MELVVGGWKYTLKNVGRWEVRPQNGWEMGGCVPIVTPAPRLVAHNSPRIRRICEYIKTAVWRPH